MAYKCVVLYLFYVFVRYGRFDSNNMYCKFTLSVLYAREYYTENYVPGLVGFFYLGTFDYTCFMYTKRF